MIRRTFPLVGTLVVVGAVVAGLVFVTGGSTYEMKLVMRSAAQLVPGSPVWIDGAKSGEVTELDARNGKALVTVTIDDDHAPLHAGTTSRVAWKSVLGERVLTVNPGPAQHAEIPEGAMYQAASSQIEVDQVLSALDEPTRKQLTSLFRGLDATLEGSEGDLKPTLQTAGPTVEALGAVLEAVGRDGPAIRALVTQLRDMTATIADRRGSVESVVNDLTEFTVTTAEQQEGFSEGFAELPATLRETRETLERVPAASDATIPLLEDLRPGVSRLPSVARNLSPVLSDLRPTVAQLRPTLVASNRLLQDTPGLLDTAHGVVPPVETALRDLGPAVSFLRPYTPELTGWLTNWNTQYSTYDSQGHMWSGLLAPGPAGANEQVGPMAPPLEKSLEPAPGAVVGQPWTDANGEPIR